MYKWDEMSWREKNALVAEKVMGWAVKPTSDDLFFDGIEVSGPDFYQITKYTEKWYETQYAEACLPHYTTDISAAWEVVEKMKQTRTWAHVDSLKSGKWSAHFGQFDFSFAEADTVPEAICLAALRAVGVEIE